MKNTDNTSDEITQGIPDVEADTAVDGDESTGEDTSVNAEAARWRRRLRDTEAELKAVTAQLDAVQRQQVEAALSEFAVKPDALWSVATLPDLLAEDGSVSADKLAQAIDTARERFGIPKQSVGSHVPGIGNQPNTVPRVNRWREAFTPAKKR